MLSIVQRAFRAVLPVFQGKVRTAKEVQLRSISYITIVVEADKPKHLYGIGIDRVERFHVYRKGNAVPHWRYRGEYGCFDKSDLSKAEACLRELKRPGLMKLRLETQHHSWRV